MKGQMVFNSGESQTGPRASRGDAVGGGEGLSQASYHIDKETNTYFWRQGHCTLIPRHLACSGNALHCLERTEMRTADQHQAWGYIHVVVSSGSRSNMCCCLFPLQITVSLSRRHQGPMLRLWCWSMALELLATNGATICALWLQLGTGFMLLRYQGLAGVRRRHCSTARMHGGTSYGELGIGLCTWHYQCCGGCQKGV